MVAKKLEQKPKGEGIPTTAKVRSAGGVSGGGGRGGGSQPGECASPTPSGRVGGHGSSRGILCAEAQGPPSGSQT